MGKVTLTNLAEELAAKCDLGKEAADNFVRAIVEIIEKGLREDNIVKIKGLGTFKLMEMSERSSVDVNTGERIIIKGHTKVSFTPDSAMKEFVNRPFAHFEPTELNDGYPEDEESVVADDISVERKEVVMDTIVEDSVAEANVVVTDVEDPKTIDYKSIEAEEVIEDSVSEVVMAELTEDIIEEPVAEAIEDSVEVSTVAPVEESAESQEKQDPSSSVSQKEPSRRGRWFFALLLVALVGAFYYYLSVDKIAGATAEAVVEEQGDLAVKTNLQEELGAEWDDMSSKKDEFPKSEQDSVSIIESESKVVAEVPSIDVVSEVVSSELLITKELKDITLADTTDYIIAGTQTSHVLKRGETIIQLSLKYYGDKRLWPYIVKHNSIADFNKVAIGMKIDIPVLKGK